MFHAVQVKRTKSEGLPVTYPLLRTLLKFPKKHIMKRLKENILCPQ